MLFSPLFVFSNGSIFFFFVASKKPWRTIAVLFSSQCFPIPRVVVKKSFSTRKTILFLYCLLSPYFFFEKILSYPKDYLIPLLFTLSVFLFFHSPTMSCLSRGETNEMTTRIFAEKKKASGFLKTTTTSKPPRQVSIYCPLKHIF